MANCKSNNSGTENHAGGTLENRKRWTSLSTNLARLTNKVNSSRSDGMKQRVIEGSMLTSLGPHNIASPYSESLGAMKDKGFDNSRVRNVFSKGDLTQMTSSSSFEESSTATESSETGNYADKYGGRPAFRRSLTDEDYNRFLDFLEAPSPVTTRQSCSDEVLLPSVESKSTTSDTNRRLLNAGSLSSHDNSRPCPENTTSNGEDLSFDLLLPSLQGTPHEDDHYSDDVSILPTDDFDDLAVDRATDNYIQTRGSPLSRGKESIASSAIAWSALAALLGTHSPSGPFQEKKARVIKNLWIDDVANEDDIISLAESEGFDMDDAASMPSLDVLSDELL